MTQTIHAAPADDAAKLDKAAYDARYAASVADPDGYWREGGTCIDWSRPYTQVKDTSFDEADFRIRWFADGALNVSVNCLDRHLATRGDQVAIIWEGDEPGENRRITYRELHRDVCRFANVLKELGVGKGDRVTLYLPMIAEAAAACGTIGR